jgi:hypothetical protein
VDLAKKESQRSEQHGCHTEATSSAVEGKVFFLLSFYDRVIFGYQQVSF